LLKRRIREAYRQNKSLLYTVLLAKEWKLILVIQYQHKEIQNYQIIEEGVIKGLKKLIVQLNEGTGING